MITSVKGVVEAAGVDWVDLAIGGVTVRVFVPASDAVRIGVPGDRVRLSTSLQVREESLTLFGFLTDDGRSVFEALIGVSGVGPRVALSVLSTLPPESLALAVASGDTDAFGGVAGVGSKLASRIVLELKGKLGEEWVVARGSPAATDVIEALTALGYSAAEVRAVTSTLHFDDGLPLEERVRMALQRIGDG